MVLTLDTPQARRAYFSRCVGTSLDYWFDYLAQHNHNIEALDSEWEAMAKVVVLTLRAPAHWGQVYKLSTILAEFMERRGYWDASQAVLTLALDTAGRSEEPKQPRRDTPAEAARHCYSMRRLQAVFLTHLRDPRL